MTDKPRSDSKLHRLPQDAQDQLIRHLMDGMSLIKATQWVEDECGIRSSKSAMGRYYQSEVAPIYAERRRLLAREAHLRHKSISADPVNWRPVLADRIAELAFSVIMADKVSPKEIAMLHGMLMDEANTAAAEARNETNERKIALAEERDRRAQKAAEQVQKLRDLPPETPDDIREKVLDAMDDALGIKK